MKKILTWTVALSLTCGAGALLAQTGGGSTGSKGTGTETRNSTHKGSKKGHKGGKKNKKGSGGTTTPPPK